MNLALSTAREAQTLLRRYLPVSRLIATPALCAKTGSDVYLKVESDLPTGSFKPRGALYALSLNTARRPIHEVTAFTTCYRMSPCKSCDRTASCRRHRE